MSTNPLRTNRTVAILLAAGSGSRFGADKMLQPIRGKPLWLRTYEALAEIPEIDAVGIVAAQANVEAFRRAAPEALFVVSGGNSRQESCRKGVDALPPETDVVLVHDAARPFVTREIAARVLAEVERRGAAAPAVPITDTVRRVDRDRLELVDRRHLVGMQTPQGARVAWLRESLAKAEQEGAEYTDELALLAAAGFAGSIVDGSPENFKVTTPSDAARASAAIGPPEVRVGIGYDIHPFSDDTEKVLVLGGVRFPGHRALEGHSDADAMLHAVADAMLGAAALGDIGHHFPNTDPRWKGARSDIFLRESARLVKEAGWMIANIDVTVVAESPKLSARIPEMRDVISQAVQLDPSRISIKATTNERLGSLGRGEGIAAMATCTLAQIA